MTRTVWWPIDVQKGQIGRGKLDGNGDGLE